MNPTQNIPPEQEQQPQNPPQEKLHPMVVLRPGERVIGEIKRHPFGILSVYFSGAIAIVAAFTIAILAPNFIQQSGDSILGPALLAAGILSIGIACILWIATSIYWQNRWIITDDSITQIIQDGLFGRRVSQLSMENLEDITVDQRGIIQSMFNFGTLKAETAGERAKFVFPFCPNPNAYARKILEVHETFLHQSRHQPQQVNPVTPMDDKHPYRPQPEFSQPQPQQLTEFQVQPTDYQQQMPNQQFMPPAPQQPAQQMDSPQNYQQQYAPPAPAQNQQPQQYQQPIAPQTPHFPGQAPAQQGDHQTKSPAIWGD